MTQSPKTTRSNGLFEAARKHIPGGVNSPVRACGSVGANPLFVSQGDGCTITDADGNSYIDFVCSWGPLILGHTHSEVLDTITETMGSGTTFGAPTELEVNFAAAVCDAVPSIDKVRAVSSGTEATMSALRLARGFTGRDKIVKVDGGYHGHADFLLVAAGSGAATLGIPGSSGVPEGSARDTLLVPFNDIDAMRALFAAHEDTIAAVILEPIPGNMGVVPPAEGYLAAVRELTEQNGAVFIFDEVISGFRASYGGAQQLYGITPDLTCLGKIIGGGMPAACFGGRADIMGHLAPDGAVYQAGTLSGNPLAMAAGIKTMEILRRPGSYDRLEVLGARLEAGVQAAIDESGIDACINRVGSVMTLFFCKGPVTDYDSAKTADTERFGAFYRAMRDRGIFLPPSQFEAWFVSLAHGEDEIDRAIEKVEESLKLIGD
jgi:glutamate-1-semialdehyde 2,1-aminomutase